MQQILPSIVEVMVANSGAVPLAPKPPGRPVQTCDLPPILTSSDKQVSLLNNIVSFLVYLLDSLHFVKKKSWNIEIP